MSQDHNLQALAGLAGCRVFGERPLDTESRNSLWRVALEGSIPRAILKVYDPAVDPHAANRFRREEKVLTLLAGIDPAVAPRVIAGFVSPMSPAMLLMEDAGEQSLADQLLDAGVGSQAGLWRDAVAFVTRLHSEMDRRRQPLYRTAMAISLDRITAAVLVSRFRIAAKRLTGSEPSRAVLNEFRALMAPVLAAPKAMIHNSLSPLNIVIGPDGWRAIDWETLTLASPLWDWADLLCAPYNPLPFTEAEAVAVRATGAEPSLFHRVAVSRCLDGLATVTLRRRRYEEMGRTERAAEYYRRAACYAGSVQEAVRLLALPPALAHCIDELTGVAP